MPLSDVLSRLAVGSVAYQQAQDQHAEYQQLLRDQATKSNVQDIMNRLTLEGVSRPVQAGTVQDQMNLPDTVSPGNPGSSAGIDQSSIPNYLQRPPEQQDTGPDALSSLPTSGTSVPTAPYNYVRKPDASRTVTYKDSQGNAHQYELLTPEEQAQRQRQRAIADQTSEQMAKEGAAYTTRQAYGITPAPGMNSRIGVPEGTKWLPAEWDKIAERIINATKQRDLHFDSSTDDQGNVTINGFDPVTGKLVSTSRTQAGGKSAGNSSHLTTDDDGNVTAFTLDRKGNKVNQVDLGPVGKSRNDGSLTPGQRNVQDRFTQRRLDQQKKDLQAVQQKEDDEHSFRIATGQQLANPSLADNDRAKLQAALKASTFKIQAYQSRKAEIMGTKAPAKAITDKIPEGGTATAPDGHVWQKKDGIVYIVR